MLQCDPLRKISIVHTTREIDFVGLVQTLCEVGVILIPKSNRGITIGHVDIKLVNNKILTN